MAFEKRSSPVNAQASLSADASAVWGVIINGSAMNSPVKAGVTLPLRASCRQRCTTLALMPRAIAALATMATDAPCSSHAANTLGLHRRAVPPPGHHLLACHRVHPSDVDTILAADSGRFKMTLVGRLRPSPRERGSHVTGAYRSTASRSQPAVRSPAAGQCPRLRKWPPSSIPLARAPRGCSAGRPGRCCRNPPNLPSGGVPLRKYVPSN